MEKIIEVKIDKSNDNIEVHFANSKICYWNGGEFEFYKGLKFKNKELNDKPKQTYLTYSKFSKPELKELQYILLNAYVFCYDTLHTAIEKSASKNDMDNLKEAIKGVRLNLRYLTNYIEDYDEMMEEYKDV